MPAIINSDDGVVSGSAGLKTSGANDGILALQNNGTTNVTVTATGNVGIGTSSPAAKLGVTAAGDAIFNSQVVIAPASGANPAKITFNPTVSSAVAGLSDGAMAFYGNGANTERMRIDSSGNVGIGTSSPSTKLNVIGDIQLSRSATASDAAINFGSNSNNYIYSGNSSNVMAFATNGSERARITSGGDFQFNSGYGSVATAYGCRAWVNFNGTGTVAIRASGNVTSITDNNTGDYTVNITTAMPDANYALVATARGQNDTDNNSTIAGSGVLTTTTAKVHIKNGTNAAVDSSAVNVAIFR